MQQRTKLAVIIAISVLLTGIVGYTVVNAFNAVQPKQPVIELRNFEQGPPPTSDELLRLVNEERAKVGAPQLVVDEDIRIVAQMKADDMVAKNYFAHHIPGTDRILNDEMAAAHKGKCRATSENIYWGRSTNTSAGAVSWWVNSKPHREAMLNPDYTVTGFGVADNKVVQHFCIK